MTSTPRAPLPLGTLIADRFAVKRVVGHGGMASVVAAEDMRLYRTVAVKILRDGFASDGPTVARFVREAQAMARLRNEHVVEVLDVGRLPHGPPYFVMEYVEGVSLAVRLAVAAPPSVDEVLDYTLQTLEALAEAHQLGIVHRDLKPENLMLTEREDGTALIKVIDFGISKQLEPEPFAAELTQRESFLGSPEYASPEQYRSTRDVDVRTDIWSLGVVMYRLLSGKLPFEASTTGMVSAVSFREPQPLAELAPHVPAELAAAVARCLERDPADRFATVQDLARALAPLATEPHLAVSIQRVLRSRGSVPPAPERLPSIHPTATTIASSMPFSATASAGRGRFVPWAIGLGAVLVMVVNRFEKQNALPSASETESRSSPVKVSSVPAAIVVAPLELATNPELSARATPPVVAPAPASLPKARLRPVVRALRPAEDASRPSPPPDAAAPSASPGPRPLDPVNPFTD